MSFSSWMSPPSQNVNLYILPQPRTLLLENQGAFTWSNSFYQNFSFFLRLLLCTGFQQVWQCKHLIQHVWQHHQILDELEKLSNMFTWSNLSWKQVHSSTGKVWRKFDEKVWSCKPSFSAWRWEIPCAYFFPGTALEEVEYLYILLQPMDTALVGLLPVRGETKWSASIAQLPLWYLC